MLIDDLRLHLKDLESDILLIKTFYNNAKVTEHFDNLEKIINSETFWQHKDQIKLSKEYQRLKVLKAEFGIIMQAFNDNQELIELFGDNEEELTKLQKEIVSFVSRVQEFKLSILMNQPHDNAPCFLSINAGAGGTESQDWAEMLLRMYLRFCEKNSFNASILDYQSGEEAGIKSATIYVKGNNCHGFLETESGIHRLVRISPFDSNKRRHTSFASVNITPEIADEKIEINENELRIDTYRAGGAGGQHVNKTDSAVRITHIPTNIVVQCQNERSQLQNKQTAMKMLKAKLIAKQEEEKKAKEASKEKQKIEWGFQIRSYVLHPYKMVKDHRTNVESYQPENVLDGDLLPFIEQQLLARSNNTNNHE